MQSQGLSGAFSSTTVQRHQFFGALPSLRLPLCACHVTWLLLTNVTVPVCSVVPTSLRPHGLQPARLLGPWDFPGKSTGMGCLFLLQGIVPTQSLNLSLLHHLHRQVGSLALNHWVRHILEIFSQIKYIIKLTSPVYFSFFKCS